MRQFSKYCQKWRKIAALHLLLILLFPFPSRAAEVIELQVVQQDNNVVFTYDLIAHANESTDEITLEYSLDGGGNWQSPQGVWGDIGKAVSTGGQKSITWSVLMEFPKGMRQSIKFRVLATVGREKEKIVEDVDVLDRDDRSHTGYAQPLHSAERNKNDPYRHQRY